MLERLVDYRIGGVPQYYLGDPNEVLMQVPDEVRKCVVFVCCKISNAPETLKYGGTAFFVGEQPFKDDEWGFTYLVTARHVIMSAIEKGIDRKIYLRWNTKDGSAEFVATGIDKWFCHHSDSSVDVAILPLIVPKNVELRQFPLEGAATKEAIKKDAIGIGDEVFLTGLFSMHRGSRRNIPIIRVGNIAAMPEEPIRTRGGTMDAYLIEARSIGGLSGSPVFVNLAGVRYVKRGSAQLAKGPRFRLLGLVHGHWDIDEAEIDSFVQDDTTRASVNMGIAIVVPVHKIIEVINHPILNAQKKKLIEERIKERMPKEDDLGDAELTQEKFHTSRAEDI